MTSNESKPEERKDKATRDRDEVTDAEFNMRALESPQIFDFREPVLGPPRWLKKLMQYVASLWHRPKQTN